MSADPNPSPSKKRTLLLALSGPTSSGKTTLSRLLHQSIFPASATILLHLDDFYRPESSLPIRDGLLDWDSAGALDLDALQATLTHLSTTGHFPDGFESKEDRNSVGTVPISDAALQNAAAQVRRWWDGVRGEVERVVIVDGFLLLGKSVAQVRELFDVRILLRAGFADAKARRERRNGYATLEGWWSDPEGYMERVVWPGFVEEHAFLFLGGDVEGEVDQGVVGGLGVDVCPTEVIGGGEGGGLDAVLGWVVDTIVRRVDEVVAKR